MGITVVGSYLSPYTLRVLIELEELGVDYEWKPVDIKRGEHRTPEFRKLQVLALPRLLRISMQVCLHCPDCIQSVLFPQQILTQFVFWMQPFGQVPVLQDDDLTIFGELTIAMTSHSISISGFNEARFWAKYDFGMNMLACFDVQSRAP